MKHSVKAWGLPGDLSDVSASTVGTLILTPRCRPTGEPA